MTATDRMDGGERIDLALLTAAERDILRLLAQGHTAKSVAALTDRSESAVNERLREARRKTGFASSRELARRYVAQISGDEEMGVATPRSPVLEPNSDAPGGRARYRRKEILVMAALLATAAVGFALLQTPSSTDAGNAAQSARSPVAAVPTPTVPSSNAPSDPVKAMLAQDGPRASDLRRQLAAEERDPDWAPQMERRVRARYAAVRFVDGGENPLSVTCGSTLCEVSGMFPVNLSERDLNASMTDIQTKTAFDITKLGLKSATGMFGSPPNIKPRRNAFVLYWWRVRN